MAFDSFNVFLVGFAVLLLVVAIYRANGHASLPKPKPKGPLGFRP